MNIKKMIDITLNALNDAKAFDVTVFEVSKIDQHI